MLNSFKDYIKKTPYKTQFRFMFMQLAQLLVIYLVFLPLIVAVANWMDYCPSALGYSVGDNVILFIVAMPIKVFLETLIYQYCVFHVFNLIESIDDITPLYILTSAILFAVVHFIGIDGPAILMVIRFLTAFFAGIVFAASFNIIYLKGRKPLLSVFCIHTIYNFIIILTCVFFELFGINLF